MGLFSPVKRPEPILPDSTLDEDLQNSADDADLTLYFVNMVVVSATDLPNVDMALVGKTDAYCEVAVGGVHDRTRMVKDDLNPVWNERMSFFVPKKPEAMTFAVRDRDTKNKDDDVGTAEFEFGSFFEIGGSYEGSLDLTTPGGDQKGTIQINVKCRTLRPVETEIKLGYAEKQLDCLGRHQSATESALDESEELRKQVVGELDAKEQEVLQKAAELEEAVTAHNKELSEKDQALLDRAQEIEAKIQEKEEAEVARREEELKRQEAETKLTAAEEEILAKAELLEEKERTNKEALTEKEKEILDMADKLELKEKAHENIQERLSQVENLKAEVENELTSKEKIIQEQARRLEVEAREHGEALSKKELELLEKAKALEERDEAARKAQERQDESDAALAKLGKEHGELVASLERSLKEQAEQLELSSKEHGESLGKKDQKILEQAKALEEAEAELQKLREEKTDLKTALANAVEAAGCAQCVVM